MGKRDAARFAFVFAMVAAADANAWFFFIPTGAIARALETDPDSVSVSTTDRVLGKCAAYHVNQAQRFATPTSAFPGEPPRTDPPSPDATFHRNMAEVAVRKASEQDKVKSLGNAYSVRWGRVAGADINANRAFGADLARGCVQNDIPVRTLDYPIWRARQDEKKQVEAEEERKRVEETRERARIEEAVRRATAPAPVTAVAESVQQVALPTGKVDFTLEARKSARILSCATDDVRTVGIEGQNILFAAACGTGETLVLSCDPSGLCLRKQQ
jgi:hypothetical protein